MCVHLAATLCPLHAKGLKILHYLDDWLICAPTEAEATSDIGTLLNLYIHLGSSCELAEEQFSSICRGQLSRNQDGFPQCDCSPIASKC